MNKCFYNTQGDYTCSFITDDSYNIDYKALWETENVIRPKPANIESSKPEWIFDTSNIKNLNTGLLYEYFTSPQESIHTCTGCGITSSNYTCQCIYNNSLSKKSLINLYENIGNANGELGFGLTDYHKTCVSCGLSNSYQLNCNCLNSNNLYKPSTLDLTKYIYNSNGSLAKFY